MKHPLDVSPSKGNQGTTRGKEKILLTSVGIEPTTSGFDLPILCRLSYQVGQRKSWVSHSTWIYNFRVNSLFHHLPIYNHNIVCDNNITEAKIGERIKEGRSVTQNSTSQVTQLNHSSYLSMTKSCLFFSPACLVISRVLGTFKFPFPVWVVRYNYTKQKKISDTQVSNSETLRLFMKQGRWGNLTQKLLRLSYFWQLVSKDFRLLGFPHLFPTGI